MPFKHLSASYRDWLLFFIFLTWAFSSSMGTWQAWVHRVGPSAEDNQYFLCGAEEGVAQSFFVPLTGE